MTTNRCTFCKSENEVNRHHIIPRRYGTQISCGSFYTCKRCHLICEKYADILVQTILHNRVDIERLQKNVIEFQEKNRDFTAKLIQKRDNLVVAEASSNNKENTEKEIQHYYMMYSQDEEQFIKRNYKMD